ncbi:DUF2298 domain-containing protein [bacterium]|nr:DUF2298 domain-containing protein [bacterium]
MDFVWALSFLLGYELLSLPLRAALATSPANGAIRRVLSRLAGPAAFCLPVWILGHFWPGAISVWFFWFLYLVCGALLLFRVCRVFRGLPALKILGYDSGPGWFGRFGVDLLSVALFFGYIALRRYSPDMTAYPINSSGAEKFTNAMLFWANWHAAALPPQDYWLAGQSLVYYYWGHFFWAWTGRMIGAPAALTINLALARITLLVFEASWLLARSVRLPSGWASVAGLIAAWGGNIAAIPSAYALLKTGVPINWGGYSYWDARSVMPGTVNEFPAFTAILGDFHSHHMALPWLIAWLAIILAARRWARPALPVLIAWIALGAGAAFSNLWNLPLMAWAIFLALLWIIGTNVRAFAKAAGAVVVFGFGLAIGMHLMRGGQALPLNETAGGGILSKLPLKFLPEAIQSTFGQLIRFWGLPMFAIGLAACGRAALERRWFLTLLILSAVIIAVSDFSGPFLWLVVSIWSLILILPARYSGLRTQDSGLRTELALLMFGVLAVLIGLELVFIDDFYSGEYERYNTYFKFSYPLWPALIVCATVAARSLWRSPLMAIRWIGRPCLIALALAAAVYPIFAFPARIVQARATDEIPMPPTLNAVDFLKYQRIPYRIEVPLIDWIRRNVPPGERVAEAAAAEPYSYGGRVASLAGRPIPLGWAHHETQWRGPAAQDMIQRRTEWIDKIYKSPTTPEILAAARALRIRWVLWGIEEERRYGVQSITRLRAAGRIAAANDGSPYAVIDLGPQILEEHE